MKVKIITVSLIDVKNNVVASLEAQINEFIATVMPVGFSYSSFPGFQNVLISYRDKPKPESKRMIEKLEVRRPAPPKE